MTKGRMQFTLGGLMVLVAVCGFEVFRYRRNVEQKAEMKLATSMTDNLYLYAVGVIVYWSVFWVVFSRVRAAKSVAANRVNQEPDREGTHA